MMLDSLHRAIEFLRSHQNTDGGWSYRPGGESLVEPTGLTLLALLSGGDGTAAGRGLDFLKACLKDSGAIGIDPKDAEGGWMAYAALLAFRALGAAAEERRLTDWVLNFEDASGRFNTDEVSSIAMNYRYDASIRGWPWTPGTTAWVEPTSLFMIALARVGVSPNQARMRSGVRLLLDRKIRTGGWNFGNPYSRPYDLEASLMSTALALTALGAAGLPQSRPAVSEGLRSLSEGLAGVVSTASLAWSLFALKSFPSATDLISDVSARLAALQAESGSFRDNVFETALSGLALSSPTALLGTSGKRGERPRP